MAKTAQQKAAEAFDAELKRAREKNPAGPSGVQQKASDAFDREMAKNLPGWAKSELAKKKAPSLLGQAGNIVAGLPRGVLALGKEAGVEAANTAKQWADVLPGVSIPSVRPRKGESFADFYTRTHPLTGGIAESAVRTGGRVTQAAASVAPGGLRPSETEYAKASREGRILGTLLEDVGNVALTGGVVSKVAGKAGLAKVAKVADAPNAAGRAAKKTVAKAATKTYEKVAASPGTAGELVRFARLDPDSRLLRKEAIDPAAEKVSEGIGQAVKRGESIARVLPDLDHQRAMTLVGEGEAPALAKLRAHLPSDEFDDYVAKTFGPAVPRTAVDLAADVAEGKAPELAAKIDEALRIGREAPGGRADRAAAYQAPGVAGRAEQAGFKPLPLVVDKRLAPLQKLVPRAEREAIGARAQATRAADRLSEVDDRNSAVLDERAAAKGVRDLDTQQGRLAGALVRQQDRAVRAADRLTSMQDAAVAARVLPVDAPTPLRPLATGVVRRAAERNLSALDRAGSGFDKGAASVINQRGVAEAAGARFGSAVESVAERGRRQGTAEGRSIGRSDVTVTQARRLARLESRRAASLVDQIGRLPEQPLPAKLAATEGMGRSVGRAQTAARITENVARSAETRSASLAGKIEAARRDVEYSLDAAPARLRPVLARNREAASLLTQQENRLRGQGLAEAAKLVGQAADELPVTLERLKAAGADFDHFVHLRLDAKPSPAGVVSGSLPKLRKGREQRQRKGSTTYDRTVRAQTQAEIDTLKNAVAAQTVERIATMPFAKRFSSVEEAAKAGYVGWDAKSPFEKSAQLTASTVFVPEAVFTNFRSYFKDPGWDKVLKKTYDPLIQAFKIIVLPLSPSWQVGNVFGNALLATVGGGVGPVSLARQLVKTTKLYRASGPTRSFEAVGPRRLYTAGPTHEEFSFLKAPEEQLLGDGRISRGARTAARPVAAVVRKSYALNGFVDNLGRSAVYLAKVEKGASPESALRSALSAMGDFSRMTPTERRFIRRVIPFYAWQRHLTQLAFRLPVEAPLRTAWTLHLADQYGRPGQDEEDLPGFMRGAIPAGDKLLGTRGLNPFSQVGGPVLNPRDLPRSLSPVLKIPFEQATGLNTFSGRPFTRPRGTSRLDDLGRDMPTAPSLVKQITDISPQKRLLESLQGRGAEARYESGDPYLPVIKTDKTPAQGLLRFLGFPLTSKATAEAMAKNEAERRAQNAKDRARRKRREAAKR